jgi:hypothetical protein
MVTQFLETVTVTWGAVHKFQLSSGPGHLFTANLHAVV